MMSWTSITLLMTTIITTMTIKLHYKEINNIMDDNTNKDNDSIDNKIFF